MHGAKVSTRDDLATLASVEGIGLDAVGGTKSESGVLVGDNHRLGRGYSTLNKSPVHAHAPIEIRARLTGYGLRVNYMALNRVGAVTRPYLYPL